MKVKTKLRLEDILVRFFESQQQAGADFCGEQRKWHLPRLNDVAQGLMMLFPVDCDRALTKIRTPYDESRS